MSTLCSGETVTSATGNIEKMRIESEMKAVNAVRSQECGRTVHRHFVMYEHAHVTPKEKAQFYCAMNHQNIV